MKRFVSRWLYGRTGGMQHRMLSWPLALLIVLAIHGVSAHFLLRLQFNNAPEVYYPATAPAVQLRDAMRRDFPTDEVLTVLFTGDDIYQADFLQRLQQVVAAVEAHPLVDRVMAVTTYERIAGTADGFGVEPLLSPSVLRGATPEALRERVLADRFVPGLLASRDGRYLAMAVRPRQLTESGERLQVKLAVAAAVSEAGLWAHYAGDAGQITMDVAQLESIFSDTTRFVPLTIAIGLALMSWVVGRLLPVVIGGIAMSTVVLPVLAGIAASGQPYTMATAILPSLLAAYTVATLLHLYAGVQRGQRSAQGRAQSLDRALSETRRPGAYNVLTTSAGLLSLLLVPIPPIQVFGLAGSLGTLMVFLTVYWLVPPFLRHWDRGNWPQNQSGMNWLGRGARKLTLGSMRYPKFVVVAFAGLVAVLLPLTQQVVVQTDVRAFFASDHPINVNTRLIESQLSGTTSLEISLRGDRDVFQRVDTLRELKRLQTWLEEQPEVDRALSMVDLVEEMHWAMNGERTTFRALPDSDRLLSQYVLIYDGEDLYELVNRDFDHARIVLNLNVHGTREIGRAVVTIRDHLAARPLPGLQVEVGGAGRLLADQVDLLVDGQLKSFAGAFAQIFILMALLWRSAKGAALCMVPNLAPLFFVFVLMGAFGIALDLATVMIASVVLGITIDDTIHLYHGYRQRLQAGLPPIWAIARSYESSGRAVLATSVVLVAQFGLLAGSSFIPTANFGLLTAAGLAAGLAFEVLLLPALLVLGHGQWRELRSVDMWRPRFRRSGRSIATAASAPLAAPSESAWPATQIATRDSADTPPAQILVCHGKACRDAGAEALCREMRARMARARPHGRVASIVVARTGCVGRCAAAPVVQTLEPCSPTATGSPAELVRRIATRVDRGLS